MSKTLEQFRKSFGSTPVEVDIDLGKDASFSVWLRPLKSRDRDNFEASVVGVDGHRDLHNLRARLVALCWVDEDGTPVGSEDEIGDLQADFVGALFDAVRKMNGMDTDSVEEAGKG